MESNYQEEEEEEVVDDLGVGRSYECVFCKRGFNTAQALGGHMNIHRKHRARNKHAPRFYHHLTPSSSSPRHFPYATTAAHHQHDSHRPHPQPSNSVIPVDWRSMSLSLPRDVGKKNTLAMNQHKELDLELRLGYD